MAKRACGLNISISRSRDSAGAWKTPIITIEARCDDPAAVSNYDKAERALRVSLPYDGSKTLDQLLSDAVRDVALQF